MRENKVIEPSACTNGGEIEANTVVTETVEVLEATKAKADAQDTTETLEAHTSTPKPVFIRLLTLFGGGVGCAFVGIVVTLATGDLVLLALSGILGVAFITKGFLLRRKIKLGQIYSVSGVCVSVAPKMLGRYRRIELVDVTTGDDAHFILPKKVVFKVGHVYTCYFDNQISRRPENLNGSSDLENFNSRKNRLLSTDFDLPANGFLGFEDFGVYQEKPVPVASVTPQDDAETSENEASNQ